jgi:hypothetical protein
VASKQRHELWAEAIRDMGILFLVFAPLDTLIMTEHRRWTDWSIAIVIAVLGVALIEKGVRMGVGVEE